MIERMTDTPAKLRENALWKETYAIAAFMYGKIDELVENHPDEKWVMASKFRTAASDSMFYMAQSIGTAVDDANGYDWSNARRSLFALQTMYIFATKQKLLELEPSIVVRIDALIAAIDLQIAKNKKDAEAATKKDMEPWLEKYRLWREMNQ